MAQRNILRLTKRLFSQKRVVNSINYLDQKLYERNVKTFYKQFERFASDHTKAASGNILSKLFPTTSGDELKEKEQQKQDEENKKENEKSYKRLKIGFYMFGASATIFGTWLLYDLGSPETDSNGNVIEDEFSEMMLVKQYFMRMLRSLNYYQKMIQEPSSKKLLPDPLKPPYVQPPYTLVLEMKDILVHPDWTYHTGWRFKKRPGVDRFLEQCAKHFEIVVYTADPGITVFPVLDALDPHGYIMYRLVRDATHFVDGHHVKNLDNINRDLKKVIVVDWNTNSTKLHPNNTLILNRWSGDMNDKTLFDLASFLNTIAISDVNDVREVLEYYRQFENPLDKFRENQQKLEEQMHEKELTEKMKEKPVVKKWTPKFLGKSSY